MAERVIGYYRDPFQGSWGVTQGDPLTTWILNLVVDVIVRHWFGMLTEKKAGPDGFEYTLAEKADFLWR